MRSRAPVTVTTILALGACVGEDPVTLIGPSDGGDAKEDVAVVDSGAADVAIDDATDASACSYTLCESFDVPPEAPSWAAAWLAPEIFPNNGPFVDVTPTVYRSPPGALRAQASAPTDTTRALLKRSLVRVPDQSISVEADVRFAWSVNPQPVGMLKLAVGGTESQPRDALTIMSDGALREVATATDASLTVKRHPFTQPVLTAGQWAHVVVRVTKGASTLLATVIVGSTTVLKDVTLLGTAFGEAWVYLGINIVTNSSNAPSR